MRKNFLYCVNFSVSQIIKDYLKQNDITESSIAKKLGKSRQALNDKLKKKDIEVGLLYEISSNLKYDFFAEMSRRWKKDMISKNLMSSDDMTISRKELVKEIEEYLKNLGCFDNDSVRNNFPAI